MGYIKNLWVLPLLFVLVGCSIDPFTAITSPIAGPVSDAVVAWKEGEAEKYYKHNVEVIYKITKITLNNLHIDITKDEKINSGHYHIIAGNGDRFNINIENKNGNITCIKIRVNFFGDKDYADFIYQQIESSAYTVVFE